MKLLFLGEIVGKSGIYAIKTLLSSVVSEHQIDFVVGNGDATTGESGIGFRHAVYLRKLGIGAITGGDKIYSKVDLVENFSQARHVLRPANYSSDAPGSGLRFFSVGERSISVISLLGQAWHRAVCDNPFTVVLRILPRIEEQSPIVVIDFHSFSTAEKQTLFHLLDGRVHAIVGTGQRVQTTDSHIMPGGTAVITDLGRCGSMDSVGGLGVEREIRRFMTGIPGPTEGAEGDIALQGMIVTLGTEGQKATEVQRITVKAPPVADQPVAENPKTA